MTKKKAAKKAIKKMKATKKGRGTRSTGPKKK